MSDTKVEKKLSRKKKLKYIFFTLFFLAVVFTLVGELLLFLFKYESSYDRMKRFSVAPAKWWSDDSVSGPKFIRGQVNKSDSVMFGNGAAGSYYNRLKIVNNEGYHDKDSFIEISPDSNLLKILFIGDSFTWGASADIDSSYVDVFEKEINKNFPSVIWNTGIPATGTNHALFTTQKYLPLQKSNFVILGFCTVNDFSDNLLPFDRLFFTDKGSCLNLYSYNENYQPVKTSVRDAFINATGSYPMNELNIFQKIKARSRMIPFLQEIKGSIAGKIENSKKKANEQAGKVEDQEYKVTREYLTRINDYVKSNNAELIVLLIPHKDDLTKPGQNYLRSVKIFNELSIKHFEVIKLLGNNDYVENKWDGHWNNRGHGITGQALSKYLLEYIKGKQKN